MPQKKSSSKQSESSNGKKSKTPKNAYFLSLELENVRCFGETQKIFFSDDNNKPKRWTIILGDNGTGKTTVLQALIAIMPTKEVWRSVSKSEETIHLGPRYFIHRGKILSSWKAHRFEQFDHEVGFVKVSKNQNAMILSENSLKLKTDVFLGKKLLSNLNVGNSIISIAYIYAKKFAQYFTSEQKDITMNCFAFGASRKSGDTSISTPNEESGYQTLFDENATLLNPEEWLLKADYFVSRSSAKESKEKFKRVKEILIKVLPDVDEIKISERKEKEESFPIPIVKFHTPYGWVEAKDLSLGYRTSMAWIVDFASKMFDLYPESENPLAEPAVVLIDEIDLHLHPKWQRELLDYLSNLFPNTQFIVTTHSPLIVQSAVARDANIVVCRREGDHVVIDQSVEAVRNWRADQILTSDLFGLETARPKEIEPLLEEREKILSKAKLTKKDEKRLSELENEIGFMPVSENPEDDKAMDIIRRAAQRLESQNK